MLDLGLAWEATYGVLVDGYRHLEPGDVIHTRGGGVGQIARWLELAHTRGIEVRFGSRLSGLLGNHRRVTDVSVSGPSGEYRLEAGAVILCSGGFQANREMRVRHLGPQAERTKVRGRPATRYN